MSDPNASSSNMLNGGSEGETAVAAGTQAPYPLVKRDDYVRLLIQALCDLGLKQSADMVAKESRLPLHSDAVVKFCEGILRGEWKAVEALLTELHVDEDDIPSVLFLIYEQKYLELLEQGRAMEALECLRKELAPLRQDFVRVHRLSSLMMLTDANELKQRANWDGVHGSSRAKLLEKLRRYIPSSTLLPPRRLETLVLQALEFQKSHCMFHNTQDESMSLLEDHACTLDRLPRHPKHVLTAHTDEVWFVQFSHNGKFLASASRDKSAIIWNVQDGLVEPLHFLTGHSKETSFLSWSPTDEYLITAGGDNVVRLWNTQTGEQLTDCAKHTNAVTTLAWMPDGKHFVSGGLDKKIYMWDLEGQDVHMWDFARSQINDLVVSPNGQWLIVITQEKRIRLYDIQKGEKESLEEMDAITSLSISDDSRYLLVNVASQEVHLWDLDSRTLVQKYSGHKQSRFVIRSCFGGVDQGFVVSGSEDNNVYIWNREHGTLLDSLTGHTATVNSVTWNPKNPHQLAAASDDHTIRIWESEHAGAQRHGTKRKTRAHEENGGIGPEGEKNGIENGNNGVHAHAQGHQAKEKEKADEDEEEDDGGGDRDGVTAMNIAQDEDSSKPHD